MDAQIIEKELEKRIVDADKTACTSPEIANAIMGVNLSNDDFSNANTIDKVVIVENTDTNEEGNFAPTEVEIAVAQIDSDTPLNTNENVNVDTDEKYDDDNKHQYGKFKNPEELLRAYTQLEREFTRRSQKLKEFENGKKATTPDWQSVVDKFFERTPSAKPFAKDIAKKIMQNPSLKDSENCLDIALNQVLIDNYRTPQQLMADGQFLQDYVFSSPMVKDSIIANYLQEIRQANPPYTLALDGTNSVAPNRKPKSIEEAGFMFLKNNK